MACSRHAGLGSKVGSSLRGLDALWVGLAALSLHAAFTGLGPSRSVLQAPGSWQGGRVLGLGCVCVCTWGALQAYSVHMSKLKAFLVIKI